MKRNLSCLSLAILLLSVLGTGAATLYVDLKCTNPTPPYTNWTIAANDIQDAVDAASDLDRILVNDGVYRTGGRFVSRIYNRVAVRKPITIQSVNGPAVTVIEGYQMPGTSVGSNAVRCLYLGTNAALSGFTLTRGATLSISGNDRDLSGAGACCADPSARLDNCTIAGNVAWSSGGGVCGGTVTGCLISSNSAQYGGGAWLSSLTDCTLRGNSALSDGGGMCTSTVRNSRLFGNSSAARGGGMSHSTAQNCAIWGNCADVGGGAYSTAASHSTITGNHAISSGGGAQIGTLNQCIIYYNTAPVNPNNAGFSINSQSKMTYCDTTPLPDPGYGSSGNIDAEPQLASTIHLSPTSPCIQAAGLGSYMGSDIDGDRWAKPQPAIGCDEYVTGSITGALSLRLVLTHTNVAKNFTVQLTADITGHAQVSAWDFSDGTVLSNRPYASHSWSAVGDYPVVLRVYNESHPAGVSSTSVVHVVERMHYVAADSRNPVPPYTSWATAAANIQGAVDAAFAGSSILVYDGLYRTGGRVAAGATTNRVAITKPVRVQSVSGPATTIIEGYQAPGTTNGNADIRCVYLCDGADLSGFKLTSGADRGTSGSDSAGGLYCDSTNAFVANCVIANNASGGVLHGTLEDCTVRDNVGGCYASTLNRCVITRNSRSGTTRCLANNSLIISNSTSGYDIGSGANLGTHNNCTFVGNSGGAAAAYYAQLDNCIIYYNTGGYAKDCYNSALRNCCTSAQGGLGFSNEPAFLDLAGGDFRLSYTSPCINAGYLYVANSPFTNCFDLAGNPRIVGSTVDIGAYEFQAPRSLISYAWLLQYQLPTDGSADTLDSDLDGMNNWQEWVSGTIPTDPQSLLKIYRISLGAYGAEVTWQSVPGKTYALERTTNLSAVATFSCLASNLPAAYQTTTVTDTTAPGPGPFFYRITVH